MIPKESGMAIGTSTSLEIGSIQSQGLYDSIFRAKDDQTPTEPIEAMMHPRHLHTKHCR